MKLRKYKLYANLLFLIAILSFLNFCCITFGSNNGLNRERATVSSDLPKASEDSGVLPNGITYTWSEKTYKTSLFINYTDMSCVFNYTGPYYHTYTSHTEYIEWNDTYQQNVLIKETNNFIHKDNVSYYSNITFTGNMTLTTNLDVYYVNITNGNNLQFMWIAVKNGTINLEQYIKKNLETVNYTFDDLYIKETTQEVYNITNGNLLGTRRFSPVITKNTYKCEEHFCWTFFTDAMVHNIYEERFSGPLILTVQIYKTNNNEMVAWANIMDNHFKIFNDSNHNGIFDDGKYDIERGGNMKPLALSDYCYTELINKTTGTDIWEPSITSINYPNDKNIDEFVKNITFSPPKQGSGNNISWNISYNEFPVEGSVSLSRIRNYNNEIFNNTYNNLSPGNFSFGYNYNVGSDRADLDTSMELSKISNSSFYQAVQGVGLCVPYHSLFMSTIKVNQSVLAPLTSAEDLVSFNLKNAQIAQLNAGNPLKKYYELYNYTGSNDYTKLESFGSMESLKFITEQQNPLYYPWDSIPQYLLLSVENITNGYEALKNSVSFYTYQTINYPTWSGEKLIHDPTLTVFYGLKTQSNVPGPVILSSESNKSKSTTKESKAIPFGDFYLLFMILGIAVITLYKTRKYLAQIS